MSCHKKRQQGKVTAGRGGDEINTNLKLKKNIQTFLGTRGAFLGQGLKERKWGKSVSQDRHRSGCLGRTEKEVLQRRGVVVVLQG